MSEFKKYKRTQIAEIREVTQSDIDSFEARNIIFVVANNHRCEVSISDVDQQNGSPKIGDMIARNPKNHKDQLLIAEQYFKDNFEEVSVVSDIERKAQLYDELEKEVASYYINDDVDDDDDLALVSIGELTATHFGFIS